MQELNSTIRQDELSATVTNVVIHQFNGPHLANAGGSYSNGWTLNLGSIPAGNYTLFARADVGNAVAETKEELPLQADKRNGYAGDNIEGLPEIFK